MTGSYVGPLLLWLTFYSLTSPVTSFGQNTASPTKSSPLGMSGSETEKLPHRSARQLEREFFEIIRAGDATEFLTYVPEGENGEQLELIGEAASLEPMAAGQQPRAPENRLRSDMIEMKKFLEELLVRLT